MRRASPGAAWAALLETMLIALGIACVAYTVWELARAWGTPAPTLGFGAVDADTGRPLEATLDRRVRGRRTSDR